MMNIREYFHNLYQQAGMDGNEFDEIAELENNVYEMDDEVLEAWAKKNDVNLSARDAATGELIVTLWSWDMCGD